MSGRVCWFAACEDGVVGVYFSVMLLPLLVLASIAVNFSIFTAQKQYVQADADLAALSAAHHLTDADEARAAARATVAANPRFRTQPLADDDIVFGRLTPAGFVPLADQSRTTGAEAVKVTVKARARTIFMNLFMDDSDLWVARAAIATAPPAEVSFALSNCLLNLRLLGQILRPLIGAEVDTLCSGRGVDARVEVLPLLTDLALTANVLPPSGEATTYGDVLNAELRATDVLEAVTGAIVPESHETVRLGEVLYLPDGLRVLNVGNPIPGFSVQVSDLVFATAELLGVHILDLGVDLSLGGLADAAVAVTISEPRQIVVGASPGDPEAVARTSQIRLDIPGLDVLGIFDLNLSVNIANASVALADEGNPCATDPDTEVAVFDPVEASLLDLDLGIRVQDVPRGYAEAGIQSTVLADRDTQRIAFTRAQFESDPVHVFGPLNDADILDAASGVSGAVSGAVGRCGP